MSASLKLLLSKGIYWALERILIVLLQIRICSSLFNVIQILFLLIFFRSLRNPSRLYVLHKVSEWFLIEIPLFTAAGPRLKKRLCKSRRIPFSDWISQSFRGLKTRRQSFLKSRRQSFLKSRRQFFPKSRRQKRLKRRDSRKYRRRDLKKKTLAARLKIRQTARLKIRPKRRYLR